MGISRVLLTTSAADTVPGSADRARGPRVWVWATLLACTCSAATAQSLCSSDGVPAPRAVLERFISADCEACWADTTTVTPGPRDMVLDWIVPSARGDDAPLSAAATRDAQWRLEALARRLDGAALSLRTPAQPARGRARVAHGVAINGYIGTSIAFTPSTPLRAGTQLSAWLLLVETIPDGSDGTPVERNLVRNALQTAWRQHGPLPKMERRRFHETRPMHFPEGTQPSRLRVVGWVQDARGRILAAAQSRCVTSPP